MDQHRYRITQVGALLAAALALLGIVLASWRHVLLALVLLCSAAAPAHAWRWMVAPTCHEGQQSRIQNEIGPIVDTAIQAAQVYVSHMTGSTSDSYNFLWWFGAFVEPFPQIVRESMQRLDDSRTAGYVQLVDCPADCGGYYAWSEPGSNVIHTCPEFWDNNAAAIRPEILIFELTRIVNKTQVREVYRTNGSNACRAAAVNRDMVYTTTDAWCWEGFITDSARVAAEKITTTSCSLGGQGGPGGALPVLLALGIVGRMSRRRRRWFVLGGAALLLLGALLWTRRPPSVPDAAAAPGVVDEERLPPVGPLSVAEQQRRARLRAWLDWSPPAPAPAPPLSNVNPFEKPWGPGEREEYERLRSVVGKGPRPEPPRDLGAN